MPLLETSGLMKMRKVVKWKSLNEPRQGVEEGIYLRIRHVHHFNSDSIWQWEQSGDMIRAIHMYVPIDHQPKAKLYRLKPTRHI